MQPAGQTIFVHQPNPLQLNNVTTVQQPATPGGAAKFNGAAGASTGWVQLCCGIACIVVAIAQIVLQSSLFFMGYGIWAGILFFIPTGILGIFSAKKNTCVVVAYMVMCIISALCASSMLITESISAAYNGYYFHCYDYNYYGDYDDCPPELVNGQTAADVILAIIGLIEMIVAIVGSAYCCGGFCCGQPSPSRQFATTVVTQPGAPMVVTTAAPYPQQQPPFAQPAFAQPPAYNVQHAYPQYPAQTVQM